MAENREMYEELNALVGTLAKAFEIDEKQAAAALESGALVLDMGEDDKGRFIAAQFEGKTSRIYQGAIKHEG